MLNWIERIPHRRTLFVLFTLYVFSMSVIEIASEFAAGQPMWEMGDDLAMFLVSGLVVALFVYEHFAQKHTLGELQGQLDKARGQLDALDSNSRELASQYRQIMQRQFDAWQLTPSEQDVVLLLLKGLSFREIAELRETREKTVRQQATGVYRKAGVAGRHELAAWFFEDMLAPPSILESND